MSKATKGESTKRELSYVIQFVYISGLLFSLVPLLCLYQICAVLRVELSS